MLFQREFFFFGRHRGLNQSMVMILLKLISLTLDEIMNQSIIVNIPQQPAVRSFNTPMPISPIRNLSIPKEPTNMETKRMAVGSFKSMAAVIINLLSSRLMSFCFTIIILSAGKYFWFTIKYISTLCSSIIYMPSLAFSCRYYKINYTSNQPFCQHTAAARCVQTSSL